MGTKRTLATGAAVGAAAVRPGGLRRILAILLVVLLVGAVLLGLLLWWAGGAIRGAAERGETLPCPPEVVTLAPATDATPPEAVQAAAEAVEASGRDVTVADGYVSGADLLVQALPGLNAPERAGRSPTVLRIGDDGLTAVEATDLLAERLAPCADSDEQEDANEEPEAEAEAEPQPRHIEWLPWWPWPVEHPATWLATALVALWVVLPITGVIRHGVPPEVLPHWVRTHATARETDRDDDGEVG